MASLIADAIVDKLVGRYVTVEKKELDIGRGTLTLKGVSVRQDLFDAFSLPFAVRGGEVAELELQIPFTKLKTESVVVTIRNLTLLLSPISETPWDEALESKRAAARKQRLAQMNQARRMASEGARLATEAKARSEAAALEIQVTRLSANATAPPDSLHLTCLALGRSLPAPCLLHLPRCPGERPR